MNGSYSVTLDRVIPGPIEKVFDAWLDPQALKTWMRPGATTLATAEVDPVVGGKFTLVMKNDTQAFPHTGEYQEIDRPRKLVFTWISEPAGNSMVTVTFTKLAERSTKVTILHERLKAEAVIAGHSTAWSSILEKLEHIMEAQQ